MGKNPLLSPSSPLFAPPPFFNFFQDGGRNQCIPELSVKKKRALQASESCALIGPILPRSGCPALVRQEKVVFLAI